MDTTQRHRYYIRMNFLDVPKRYINARVNDFEKSIACSALSASFITGNSGTGKTHLLYALAEKAIKDSVNNQTISVKYKRVEVDTITACLISVPELLSNIKNKFEISSEGTYEEMIELYSTTQHLFIDDFGSHRDTGWSFDVLYSIIDYRYSHMLKTTVSSNLSIEELAKNASNRIASRLIGMGNIMELTGKNKRLPNEGNS